MGSNAQDTFRHSHVGTNTHHQLCLCWHVQPHMHVLTKNKHASIICLFEEAVSLHNRSDCSRVHKIVQLWQHFCRSANLLATKRHWAAVPFMWCRIKIQQDIISQEWDVCMLFMSIKENILINSGRARVCPGLYAWERKKKKREKTARPLTWHPKGDRGIFYVHKSLSLNSFLYPAGQSAGRPFARELLTILWMLTGR